VLRQKSSDNEKPPAGADGQERTPKVAFAYGMTTICEEEVGRITVEG
jgi:hypothetical protein